VHEKHVGGFFMNNVIFGVTGGPDSPCETSHKFQITGLKLNSKLSQMLPECTLRVYDGEAKDLCNPECCYKTRMVDKIPHIRHEVLIDFLLVPNTPQICSPCQSFNKTQYGVQISCNDVKFPGCSDHCNSKNVLNTLAEKIASNSGCCEVVTYLNCEPAPCNSGVAKANLDIEFC
jgi:hypothetical protein